MHKTCQQRISCRTLGLLLLAVFVFRTPSANATSGGVTTLPVGKINTTGVTLQVDSRWIDAVGYRPIRVTITAAKLPKYDRQFRIVLRPFGNKTQVSQILELQQGAVQTTATVLVPQDADWNTLGIDVFEDGRILDELSGGRFAYGNNWDWNESAPGLLVIDADAFERSRRDEVISLYERGSQDKVKEAFEGRSLPDVRSLIQMFKTDRSNNSGEMFSDEPLGEVEPIVTLSEINRASKAEILPPTELPERWLELSSFDLIIISQADLIALGAQHPKKLQAIAEWTRSGRTLIVYDSGAGFSGLASMEQQLQLPPRPQAGSAPYRGWRVPDVKQRGVLQNYNLNVYNNYGPRPRTKTATSSSTVDLGLDIQQPGARPEKSWGFVVRPAGLGQVVAFEGNPFPGTEKNWCWVLNSLRGSNWNPLYRTGATMQHRNEDFWNFLIAGIGEAPVFSFVIFISLFVMLIGPVNYYYLQRRQRLYLLLVTVPAGALLVTFGLFLYAVVVDGLGVKSRIRSVTAIDQRAGTGASVSRQAYYASLAPSQGFGFGDDTEIRPYIHKQPRRHSDRIGLRTVAWNEPDQQLKNGFISSRILSQLLVTKVDQTKARLQVGQVKGNVLSVTNDLQANLAWLLVMHGDGKCYAGANIKSGPAELAEIAPQDGAAEMKRRLRPFQPEFPEGYSETMHDTPLEWLDGGPYRYREPSPAEQETSLLERSIARYATLNMHPLEPQTYVAIADNSPLVPLGVRSRQYGSLHVIEGNY